MNVGIAQLAPAAGYVASIILGFLWLDARHEVSGAAERALLDSKAYTLSIAVADLTSTITRYNTFEELGQLSDANRSRREELRELRQSYISEVESLSNQKIALSN